jgi:CRISPR-associated endonuclease Cas1
MAATSTLAQSPSPNNSLVPHHGTLTLFGYGIKVSVERGHLAIEDGIGPERRYARLSRVGHGLKRLVVIGSDGFVSLSALRWLADQDAAFVMLERNGEVLATTGPVRSSDARLRRAQALAVQSGTALEISRELIIQKLEGQEQVVRHKLDNSDAADAIAGFREDLATADTTNQLRLLESQAGAAYWSAWHSLPVMFPQSELRRTPEHWRVFGTRKSPLSGSPRLAATPANAMLNYLYALLESEARLAAAALGLDPGLGVMHTDLPARDSLACDLMEPVRPQVDAYLLDWILRTPLKREWFFEQRDGNCRLMASLCARLSETAPTWARAVAPLAEWVAHALWSGMKKLPSDAIRPTRLTQSHRSLSKGGTGVVAHKPIRPAEKLCHTCGVVLKDGEQHCAECARPELRRRMLEVAKVGRAVTHTPEAQALRSATRRRQAAALSTWKPENQPAWLTEAVYAEKIQPALTGFPVSAIASALAVSHPYATDVRSGKRRPHPRHWGALARLVRNQEGRFGRGNGGESGIRKQPKTATKAVNRARMTI